MGFWEKSVRVFKCLCENGQQGVRRIAQQTGLSQSSVHRLTQAITRRGVHPESWLWETADGRQWLIRLIVATLSTCGLKRGVGLDTMSEFLTRRHLERQAGCSHGHSVFEFNTDESQCLCWLGCEPAASRRYIGFACPP